MTPSTRSPRDVPAYPPTVTVVGAGVIGLSCAVRLAEAHFAVTVVARDVAEATTSAVAGGLWMPYLASPADKVARWGRETLLEMLRLHARTDAPVVVRDGVLLYARPPGRPSWADAVADLTDLRQVTDPAPGFPHGIAMRSPIADMPHYLPWLVQRLEAAGGSIRQEELTALPGEGLVVNTTGLGARELASDTDLAPVRGQVAFLDNPGLRDWLSVEDAPDRLPSEPVYVFPRRDDVVVGGSAHHGDWRRESDQALAERMMERAVALVPQLAGARLRAHRVGLRPGRPLVRLDHEVRPGSTTIHCYGHGGAGVTLSWGCADEVLALARLTSTEA